MKEALKVLYVAMQWDYGFPERGLSFEEQNFYPALAQHPRVAKLDRFDFVDEGKKHGLEAMSEKLATQIKSGGYDFVFTCFMDAAHDPIKEVFSMAVREAGTVSLNWFCDDDYRFETFSALWAPHLSFVLSTSRGALPKYAALGLSAKVILSNFAYSQHSYEPLRNLPPLGQAGGVNFVGLPHSDRPQILRQVIEAGHWVDCYGSGWARRLSFEEMVRVFTHSHISLNFTFNAHKTIRQMKGRLFEVPGCGSLLLTDYVDGLEEYFKPNQEIAIFEGTAHLVDQIRFFKRNEKARAEMAKRGREAALARNTYEHRFEDIFKRIFS